MDISYHVSKLRDDYRGLFMHIDRIEDWLQKNSNTLVDTVPTGYITDVKECISLTRDNSKDTLLYKHLACLLQYYMNDLLRELENSQKLNLVM